MKRNCRGKFVRVCANNLHSEIAAGLDCDIDAGVSVAKLQRNVRNEWAKENPERDRVFSRSGPRKFILCQPCYNFFVDRSKKSDNDHDDQKDTSSASSSTASVSNSKSNPAVASVIEKLKALDSDELAQVAYFLGQSQQAAVKSDIKNFPANDIDALCGLNVKEWIASRNSVVCAFLKGIATQGLGSKQSVGDRDIDLAKAIEQVYYLQNKRTILPLSLTENLVSYAVARSKLVCNTNSSSSPAGSHSYITNWLKTQAGKPLASPDGDVLCAFDNDQVIGKTYHVRPDNKVKSSVITSVCYAEVGPDTNLQFNADLKPGSWNNDVAIRKAVEEVILDENSNFNKAVSKTHYKEVYKTLEERLNIVCDQQILKNGKFIDHVDDEISQEAERREWKSCWSCGTSNVKTKRICVSCSANLNAQPNTLNEPGPSVPHAQPKTHKPAYTKLEFSYLDLPTANSCSSSGIRITAGEPIFVNPNSHSSVIKVLREIGQQTNIKKYVEGGCREWVAITCDGLPYTIAQRVLKETYTCPACREAIFTRKNYVSHMKEHEEYRDTDEAEFPFDLEFDWTVLRIGHGHFEMNMVRSFFKLNWDVCLKELAKCMGFCSENAQKYAKSGGDHHKAWELLQILYLGCIDELVLPYVRECLQQNQVSTPDGFLRWTRNVKSNRYQYLQEQMLTYASAIIHLRRGIRHNDMALVLAGRVKYAPIFHSRNHPKYQQIELVELSNFLTAPTALQDFLKAYQAISTSGDPERCEDMDFILEAINKKSKSWAPKGVPTNQEWQRIFRNLQKFDELRSAVFSRMRKDDHDAEKSYTSSHIVRDEEVTAWRTCLRGSHFLDDPFGSDTSFTSVGGEKLDPELVHLTKQAMKRRRYCARKMFGVAHEDDSVEPNQVFVTEAERAHHNDIRNQRKEMIATRVIAAINALDDPGIKTMLLAEWEMSVKNKKREDFISFFFRVEEEVAQQAPVTGLDIADEQKQ